MSGLLLLFSHRKFTFYGERDWYYAKEFALTWLRAYPGMASEYDIADHESVMGAGLEIIRNEAIKSVIQARYAYVLAVHVSGTTKVVGVNESMFVYLVESYVNDKEDTMAPMLGGKHKKEAKGK